LKDLEIRGAGTCWAGTERARGGGGVDLYTRLLASAVDKARVERRDDRRQTTDDEAAIQPSSVVLICRPTSRGAFGVAGFAYYGVPAGGVVPDDVVRLRVYQRMAASMSPARYGI